MVDCCTFLDLDQSHYSHMPSHSSLALIDSHIHTDDNRFDDDRVALIQEARDAHIIAQVVPATTLRLWPRVKAVCAQEDDLHACYGLHPYFTQEHQTRHIDELALWLGREKPVAVGECGLDYQIAEPDKSAQQYLFGAQLALAREFNLPIVIHARKAVEDVIGMIRAAGHHQGLLHSFNGSTQQAKKLIDLGYKLSFGGAVTYERATHLRELVATLPLDALLLETDAPDQPPSLHHGERNHPANLIQVWQCISELRRESADVIARTTTRTAIDLFQLPINKETCQAR